MPKTDKMAFKILRCQHCAEYTLKDNCCGDKTINIIPPKYSEKDSYASYRRKVKSSELKKHGLL